MSEEKKFQMVSFGLPWYLALAVAVTAVVSAMTGVLSKDAAGCFVLMLSIGVVCNEIGERIPFWNTYVGGGLILTFLVSAILFSYDVISPAYAESIDKMMNEADLLTLYIVFLLTGSLLSLERRLLVCSFRQYIPAILGGLAGASLLGAMAGVVFGIEPLAVILRYMLPVMGGGNGGGAIPLSQIYRTATGGSFAHYYSFAITILTMANIFAVLMAAFLDRFGERYPEWTGDRKTLFCRGGFSAAEKKRVGCSVRDLGGAFFLELGLYALGRLFALAILPGICGISIHPLACMIVFTALVAMSGTVPSSVCAACRRLQAFFSKNMTLILMVGIGANTDIHEMITFLNPANVVIALAIVLGAIIGSALVGWLAGLYPIDSAITAGLCMANCGGSGDLAVLRASKRLGLMAYAQLSSRFGGGIVLILASILFGQFQTFLG